MSELPEIVKGMRLDQAMFIELYTALVEAGVLDKAEAVKKYNERKQNFGVGWL